MKRILAAVLLFLASSAAAQSISIPLSNTSFDLAGVVQQMHPCYVFDQHGDNLAGAYVVALDLHTAAGTTIAQVNAGLSWYASGEFKGQGGPMLAVGFRADNLVARTQSAQWVRDHTTAIKLPAIEIGPLVSYFKTGGCLYGLFVSTKL